MYITAYNVGTIYARTTTSIARLVPQKLSNFGMFKMCPKSEPVVMEDFLDMLLLKYHFMQIFLSFFFILN